MKNKIVMGFIEGLIYYYDRKDSMIYRTNKYTKLIGKYGIKKSDLPINGISRIDVKSKCSNKHTKYSLASSFDDKIATIIDDMGDNLKICNMRGKVAVIPKEKLDAFKSEWEFNNVEYIPDDEIVNGDICDNIQSDEPLEPMKQCINDIEEHEDTDECYNCIIEEKSDIQSAENQYTDIEKLEQTGLVSDEDIVEEVTVDKEENAVEKEEGIENDCDNSSIGDTDERSHVDINRIIEVYGDSEIKPEPIEKPVEQLNQNNKGFIIGLTLVDVWNTIIGELRTGNIVDISSSVIDSMHIKIESILNSKIETSERLQLCKIYTADNSYIIAAIHYRPQCETSILKVLKTKYDENNLDIIDFKLDYRNQKKYFRNFQI